jgi:hypothetical protein
MSFIKTMIYAVLLMAVSAPLAAAAPGGLRGALAVNASESKMASLLTAQKTGGSSIADTCAKEIKNCVNNTACLACLSDAKTPADQPTVYTCKTLRSYYAAVYPDTCDVSKGFLGAFTTCIINAAFANADIKVTCPNVSGGGGSTSGGSAVPGEVTFAPTSAPAAVDTAAPTAVSQRSCTRVVLYFDVACMPCWLRCFVDVTASSCVLVSFS